MTQRDADRQRREAATADAVNGLVGMVSARQRRPRGLTKQRPRAAVSFRDFRQLVRRHRPSELLPALAALASAGGVNDPVDTAWASFAPPWAIAVIARESLLWGNEHRDAPVDAAALRDLFNAFIGLTSAVADDLRAARIQSQAAPGSGSMQPATGTAPTAESAVLGLLVTHSYEQFPYQESQFEEVSRSHAMLVEGLDLPGLEVMSPDAWRVVFGCDLDEAFGATFFLHVAAHSNAGWFDTAWLDRDDITDMFERWPRQAIIDRARALTLTPAEFKLAYGDLPNPGVGRERYAPNPLFTHPFVAMPDGRVLAPQPALILRTITPGALFYPAKDRLGSGYARDMGHVTEAYVGRQLATIEPATKLDPEIVYGRQQRKSIDWFLDLGSLLVLVEVKSARFGLLDRAGVPGFTRRSADLINHAIDQLTKTVVELDAANPAFGHIRADGPRLGLIVTAEAHYTANSPWMRDLLRQAPFPTVVASLREIEFLVTLPRDEIERQLTEIGNDTERSTWSLEAALQSPGTPLRNRILQEAWDHYPWPSFIEQTDDDD